MILTDPSLLGAIPQRDGSCLFRVWAPNARQVAVRLLLEPERVEMLQAVQGGYHEGVVGGVPVGTRYLFELRQVPEGSPVGASAGPPAAFPDPASRYQPEGVHGPSAVVGLDFPWTDHGWRGLTREQLVLYELHVGTFTAEGTFDAIIPHLGELRELGVTALQLLPVAQFPGDRNWGYDGTYWFAVQQSYGGAEGLKRLVNAAHGQGLGVVLDVVYNHLGPEGNYSNHFGPYSLDRIRTPWGSAINFDWKGSDGVRSHILSNVVMWIRDFHVDGLRLDAVHAIYDNKARHILQEIAEVTREEAHRAGRPVTLIAESSINSPRHTDLIDRGGFGLQCQWNDDFHHALHAFLTGERHHEYVDHGGLDNFVKAYREGFTLTGEYSHYRGRSHGVSSAAMEAARFVVYSQTHDDVGNRAGAERLSSLVDFESAKLAAAAYLLSPYIPMLFMGEEYAEPAPFRYFTSHSDRGLVEGVREGRRRDFGGQDFVDPNAPEAFESSKLRRALRGVEPHRTMESFYRELLRLRRELAPLATLSKRAMEVEADLDAQAMGVRRQAGGSETILLMNFSTVPHSSRAPAGLRLLLDSAQSRWRGPKSDDSDLMLAPRSCQLWGT